MRFTWGHAAIAMPVTIVVVFVTVLIRSMADEHKTELVTDDYYAKELKFQDQIEQTKNALVFHTILDFNREGDMYIVRLSGDFEPENVEGNLVAFRPSDSTLDFELPLQLDSLGSQQIPASKFKTGKYQIQLNWVVDDTECYLEKNIFIQ